MSDIGELRRAAAEARTAYDRAQMAAGYAQTSRVNYEFAATQWRLSHQAETRAPLPIIDVAMHPPPTAEQVRRLEKAAAVAAKKLNLTRQALTDAAAADPKVSA